MTLIISTHACYWCYQYLACRRWWWWSRCMQCCKPPGMLLHGVSQLLHKQQRAMQVRRPCYKHHRKHINDSPAAAAGREKKPGGSREAHMPRHTGRAMFGKRSNKEACNMKAQGHAAHMSTQDSVAGAAWYCGSVQACLMTLLYKHILNYAIAKRCLVGTRSM